MARIAVDALGGDRGSVEVIAGRSRRRATGSTSSSSGRRGSTPQGLELVAAAERDRDAREAGGRGPREAGLESRRRLSRGRRRGGRRRRLRGEHRRDARGGAPPHPALPGRARARRSPSSIPARFRPSVLSTRARTPTRAPSTSLQFAHMGVGLRRGDPRRRQPGGAPALDRRGAREGQPADARGPRRCSRRAGSTSPEHRGARPAPRRGRRRRHRRLHRQRRAEAARGDDQRAPRRAARGDRSTPGASSAAS